jgi:hypothetical protein
MKHPIARRARRARGGLLAAGSCIALALTLAMPATAAAGWLAPVDVTPPGESDVGGHVAVDPLGNAIVVSEQLVSDGGCGHPAVRATSRRAGAGWETPFDVAGTAPSTFGAGVAVDAQGNAVATWVRLGAPSIVQAAWRPAGGTWQAAVDVSTPGEDASAPQVAIDAQGAAIVVWERRTAAGDTSTRLVRAALRPAGGTWQPPADLSAPVAGEHPLSPAIAIGPAGDAVVVWQHFDGTSSIVQSASRAPGGAWQTPVDVSAAGEDASGAQVAIDAQGVATAVWQAGGSSAVVRSATRPAGGTWQPQVSLSAAGTYGARVAAGTGGDVIAVWMRSDGSALSIEAAVRPAHGPWGSPVVLSSPGYLGPPSVAVDATGNAVVVWGQNTSQGAIQSAVFTPGGAWEPPVDLTAPAPAAGLMRVAAATSRLSCVQYPVITDVAFGAQGDAVAVWSSVDEHFRLRLQSAIFDGPGPPAPPDLGPGVTGRRRTPIVTGLALSRSPFLARRTGPAINPAAARSATRVGYRLNVAATVRFTVQRVRGGRRVAGRCVAVTRKRHGAKPCTRFVALPGSFTRRRPAGGADRFTFSGRVGGRTLGPGSYRLAATPTAGGRRGVTKHAPFRISGR